MTAAPRQTRLAAAGAGLLSGLLLSAAFHPLDQGWLAWLAPIPLLLALAHPRPRPWLAGGVFGVALSALALYWIAVVTAVGYVLTVLIQGAHYAPMAALIAAARQRGLPLWLAAPPAWIAQDFVRGELTLDGFTWLFPGHSQWAYLPLIQVADVGGVWVITALVIGGAAAVAELLVGLLVGRLAGRAVGRAAAGAPLSLAWRALGIGLAAAGLVGALGYGAWRLGQPTMSDGPRLALVQGNIPQEVKNRLPSLAVIIDPHVRLTRTLRGAQPAPDLIVWPETMLPGCPYTQADMGDLVGALARDVKTPLLIGCTRFAPHPQRDRWIHYNCQAWVGADGRLGAAYDKRRLVPCGEYIPLRGVAPWLPEIVRNMVGYVPDVTPGVADPPLFEVAGAPFGVVICNESTFPGVSRATRRSGARFIVNPTNDGWFKESAELDQVVAICVFRAIENRVGFVRSANTGISCFIDPDGRVRSRLEVGGKQKSVEGTLTDVVRLDSRRPLALAVGEWPAYLAVLLSALLGLWLWRAAPTAPAAPTGSEPR